MRNGLPSLTAIVVATARALASSTQAASCDPEDKLARDFVPAPVRLALLGLEHAAPHAPWLPRAVATASLGMLNHLALRARAIDAALASALDRGVRQVVILGAGLDTRAYRLPALAGAQVFEVDHPTSQAGKRVRAARLQPMAAAVHHVSVDFTRDVLADALHAAGFDPSVPSFWIWEGVVPYLHESAVVASMAAIAALSAPGSELAVSYVTPKLYRLPGSRQVISLGMSVLGEPVHAVFEPERLSQLLAAAGLRVHSDTSTHEWQRRFGRPGVHPRAVAYERLALALRP